MKAILVIDLPSDLDISLDEFKADITMLSKDFSKSMLFHKYKNIELKPMPKKLEVDVKKIEDIMHAEYQMVDVIQDKIIAEIKLNTDKLIALGWNGCINEILGDNDE